MKESLQLKLEQLLERFHEISRLLSEPDVINQQKEFTALSKEYKNLEDLAQTYEEYDNTKQNILSLEEILKDNDPELKEMAENEIEQNKIKLQELEEKLTWLLIPKDPDDERNIYLEIRAGTGGDEAAIFAGDLFRMYSKFAETQGWQVEIIAVSHGEHGGYKEIISRISGQDVYSQLKFESGTHRVQRVPETESQGRIHTSACTIAILPEVEEIDEIDINPDEIRVDTFRASGAGGQHVNKTDSAIRITHLPSGLVVECQDERSQHKNRAKALALLKSRLLDMEQRKQKESQAQNRKLQVGSGDRSERIRTYNYPQGRVTDHRINLTLYKLPEIMEGDLTEFIQSLQKEHYTEVLAELAHH